MVLVFYHWLADRFGYHNNTISFRGGTNIAISSIVSGAIRVIGVGAIHTDHL